MEHNRKEWKEMDWNESFIPLFPYFRMDKDKFFIPHKFISLHSSQIPSDIFNPNILAPLNLLKNIF